MNTLLETLDRHPLPWKLAGCDESNDIRSISFIDANGDYVVWRGRAGSYTGAEVANLLLAAPLLYRACMHALGCLNMDDGDPTQVLKDALATAESGVPQGRTPASYATMVGERTAAEAMARFAERRSALLHSIVEKCPTCKAAMYEALRQQASAAAESEGP